MSIYLFQKFIKIITRNIYLNKIYKIIMSNLMNEDELKSKSHNSMTARNLVLSELFDK